MRWLSPCPYRLPLDKNHRYCTGYEENEPKKKHKNKKILLREIRSRDVYIESNSYSTFS